MAKNEELLKSRFINHIKLKLQSSFLMLIVNIVESYHED